MSDSLPAVQNFDDMIDTGPASAPEFGADDFQSLFEHSGLHMVALDQYLVVQDVNADFARELRWRNARLRGRETLHFVHRSGHLHLGRQSGRLLHGKRPRISEQVLAVSRSDEVVPARYTATAVHTSASGLIRVLVILQPNRPGVREQLSLGYFVRYHGRGLPESLTAVAMHERMATAITSSDPVIVPSLVHSAELLARTLAPLGR